jgi:hypothetical protein
VRDRRVHGGLQIFDVREVHSTLGFRTAALNREKNSGQRRKPATLIVQTSAHLPFAHVQLRERLTGPERDLLNFLVNVSLMQERLNVKEFPHIFRCATVTVRTPGVRTSGELALPVTRVAVRVPAVGASWLRR